jgi:hypothetical protein
MTRGPLHNNEPVPSSSQSRVTRIIRANVVSVSFTASLGMVLTLSGCPLKDDYFIDSGHSGAAAGGSASGGAGVTGGESTLSTGGSVSGSGGQGNAGSTGACSSPCSPGRTCVAGTCSGGWVSMAAPPASFVARERPAVVSFNGTLFVFGGRNAGGDVLNSAAIYDLATDTWTLASSDAATPSPRELATAVWTGSDVLVFGGRNAAGSEYYTTGARYDPAADRWTTINKSISPRAAGVGFSVGEEVVFWGGLTTGAEASQYTSRYGLITNTWRLANSQNAPTPMLGVTWGASADSLFIYGGLDGSTRTDAAYRYDLLGDAWSVLPRGPKGRSSAFGAFDGSTFYVWGGRDGNTFLTDGAAYRTTWSALPGGNAPSARCAPPRQQGWAFAVGVGDIAFFGGQDDNGNFLTDGGRYSNASGWSSIPAWPSREDHNFGSAALVSGEVLIWGGVDGNDPTSTGERWAP